MSSFSNFARQTQEKYLLSLALEKELSFWIPDWFPKVEKEESRKWEPVLREESKRQGTKLCSPLPAH